MLLGWQAAMVFSVLVLVIAVVGVTVWMLVPSQRAQLLRRRRDDAAEIITDLDAVLSRSVGFRLNGRTHVISPLSMKEFIEVVGDLAVMDRLRTQEQVSDQELLIGFANLFGKICPSITREEVERMTYPQVAALYQLVLEQIMGRAEFSAQKKTPSREGLAAEAQAAAAASSG